MKSAWALLTAASLGGGGAFAQRKPAESWPHGPYDKVIPPKLIIAPKLKPESPRPPLRGALILPQAQTNSVGPPPKLDLAPRPPTSPSTNNPAIRKLNLGAGSQDTLRRVRDSQICGRSHLFSGALMIQF